MNKAIRILVTGGAGFIGSNLVYELNQRGYTNITIVDRLGKTDKYRNLIGLKFANYLEINEFIQSQIEPFEIIFHLGACSSTRENNASYLIDNNYEFSRRLFELARSMKSRFIYASSAATYGRKEMNDSISPEDCRPLNAYGLSKNMFDQYLISSGEINNAVGLKYFNVFGPNCEHKGVMRSFVTTVFEDIKDNGNVSMYNTHETAPSGDDRRDFLYVKDAVDITLHFAFDEVGKKATGLFNVGSGKPVSWKYIAEQVFKNLGKEPNIQFNPMPEELAKKFQYGTKADISKLISTVYTKEMTSIEDAIKDYVLNYLIPNKKRGEK